MAYNMVGDQVDDVVALHPEGVDRNRKRKHCLAQVSLVALHPEGVDRNS